MIKLGTDFSGIGAPEMALKYLGLDFKSIFACEIDKYARDTFNQLHSPKVFYNDITKRNHKEVEQLDLYVAGFPCQSFSTAGKRLGFEEARGTLFFNIAEFIKVNQPKAFILENVKGLINHESGKTFQTVTDILSNGGGTKNGQISLDIFDDGLGYHIYYKLLNSKDYNIPQNRERIFIIGFKEYRNFKFPKPLKLEFKLYDLLQDNINSKYYLSDKMKKIIFKKSDNWKSGEMNINPEIAKPITARVFKMGRADADNYISEVDSKYYLTDKAINHLKRNQDFNKFNIKDDNSILASCITSRANKISNDNNFITAHSLYPRSSKTNKGGTGPLSKSDGISYCLDAHNSQAIEYKQNIRRLTPLECWRLQGFKDEDFFSVKGLSDTQLYKQAGNSITINVLMEILKNIYGYD